MATFPFLRLPPELRLMTWRSTWEDRVVIIRVGKVSIPVPTWLQDTSPGRIFCYEARQIEILDERNERYTQDIIHTHAPLPLTLLVNRESRHETLRHYKLAFHLPGHESRIYFRHGDIPCLEHHNLKHFHACPDMAGVRELMVMAATLDLCEGEFAFRIPEAKKESWSRKWLKNGTGLRARDIEAVAPNVEWLYWHTQYRADPDPWEARILTRGNYTIWSRDLEEACRQNRASALDASA